MREWPIPRPRRRHPRQAQPALVWRRKETPPRKDTRAAPASAESTFHLLALPSLSSCFASLRLCGNFLPAKAQTLSLGKSLFHSPKHSFNFDVHADPLRTGTPMTINTTVNISPFDANVL